MWSIDLNLMEIFSLRKVHVMQNTYEVFFPFLFLFFGSLLYKMERSERDF
jgi:hypothetical protein